MAAMDIRAWFRAARNIANALKITEGGEANQSMRSTPYGDIYALNPLGIKQTAADEGSSFILTNPTPGTKIDYGSAGTQASFSDTVPFMLFNNSAPAGSGIRSIVEYVKLIQIGGTAPATTTSVQAAAKIDTIPRLNTAGSMTKLSPVCPNMDSAAQPVTNIYVPNGAVATIPASGGSAHQIGRAMLKGGPTLVLDEYTINFGPDDIPSSGGYLTTVASYQTRMGVMELGPQHWGVLFLWFPGGATNPFSFEFEISIRER